MPVNIVNNADDILEEHKFVAKMAARNGCMGEIEKSTDKINLSAKIHGINGIHACVKRPIFHMCIIVSQRPARGWNEMINQVLSRPAEQRERILSEIPIDCLDFPYSAKLHQYQFKVMTAQTTSAIAGQSICHLMMRMKGGLNKSLT